MGGIGHILANQIQERNGKETRAVVLGHLRSGGSPTAWDRHCVLALGSAPSNVSPTAHTGNMVVLTPEGVAPVKILEAIDQVRTVPPDGELVRVGQALGVSFGN